MKVRAKIVPVDPKYIPRYKSAGAACADLVACIPESLFLPPKKVTKIPLGIKVQVPPGWEMQVRSRSGLASLGLIMANGIGTIDSDYRGEVTVLLYNSTDQPYVVEDGDRVGQMSLQEVHPVEWDVVAELDPTERGEGGFGSTGVK